AELGEFNALTNIIASDGDFIRQRTLVALTRFGKKRIVNALIKALDSEDGGVVYWVSDALQHLGLGSKQAVDALIKALYYDSEYDRFNVIDALGRLGNSGIVPQLEQIHQNDPDSECRRIAQISINRIQAKA